MAKRDTLLWQMERKVILDELARNNGNRTKTARVLGIGIRTLQRKLVSYGLGPLTVSGTTASNDKESN
jgi:DNA-binding NtrC family response regulator